MGGKPFSLMPGQTLAAFDAERGVDEDLHLACPGTDPLGILGYRGAVLPPPSGRQRCGVAGAAAAARSRSGMSGCPVGEGGRPLALPAPHNGDHPGIANGADGCKPPQAPRSGRPAPRRHQDSGRAGRVGGHAGRVGGLTGGPFLGRPSGGIWDARGWRGCIPQHPNPTGSARRGVLGRPHGRRRCGSREGRGAGCSSSVEQPAGCILCGHCGQRGAHAPRGPGGRPAPPPGGCLYGHGPGGRRGGAQRPWALWGLQPLRQWRTQGTVGNR